jgi:hypothetical protein
MRLLFLSLDACYQGTQQSDEEGIYGVVSIEEISGQACNSFVGGCQASLAALRMRSAPDTLRLPAYCPHGSSDLRWPFTRRGA